MSRHAKRIRLVQKPAEQAELSWQVLFELAPDGIFIADLEGRYTHVNASGARMLGYEPHEIVGLRIIDLVPPSLADLMPKWRDALLLPGRVITQESRLRKKDGTFLTVEVSAKILPDRRWIAFVRDLSEKKGFERSLSIARQTETELRQDIQMYNHLSEVFAETLDSIPQTGLKAILQSFLLQAQAMTKADFAAVGIGTDPEKEFDPWVSNGLTPEQARMIGRHPRAIGSLGEVSRENHTIRSSDIRKHPAFRGFPEHHPQMKSFLGVPIPYQGTSIGNFYLSNKEDGREFTQDDQVKIEALAKRVSFTLQTARMLQAESQGRQWLQSVLEQMPEGVVLCDEQGRMIDANATAKELFRPDLSDHRNIPPRTPLLEVIGPSSSDADPQNLPLVQALSRRTSIIGKELLIIDRKHQEVWILASASPILDTDDKTLRGAVGVFQDISAIKELERLRQEWTSVVAHDLRQPIQVIALNSGLLNMLHRKDMSAAETKALGHIHQASSRLSRMINDLLDFSRVEANKLQVVREPTSIEEVVHASVERISGLCAPGQLKVDTQPGMPHACGDPDRIEQVLQNLVSNAVKYGDPGAEILIQARPGKQGVVVSVTNRGPGIPAAELPKVFDRFMRTKQARASSRRGLGLGLYICKGIVEAHGGRIWAESQEGQLTVFHFEIPYVTGKC